jgi:hypothetical protein
VLPCTMLACSLGHIGGLFELLALCRSVLCAVAWVLGLGRAEVRDDKGAHVLRSAFRPLKIPLQLPNFKLGAGVDSMCAVVLTHIAAMAIALGCFRVLRAFTAWC